MHRAYGLAVWRLFLLTVVSLTLSPLHWILSKTNRPLCFWCGRLIMSNWGRLSGHKLIVRGTMSTEKPTLFVANHSSYIDIAVMGSLVPARFVAKQEVAKWPVIGRLATNQDSLYIERTRTAIADGAKKILACIEAGESLILFPEGTTTDGCRVLPFGSSFFDVALHKNVTVQPITITYAGWDGLPMPRFMRKRCGWFSPDLGVGPHLWDILQWGTIQVIVEFHSPLKPQAYASRKELAQTAFKAVQQGLANAFSQPFSEKVVTT